MDYDLTRFGFKKVNQYWYFYTDNSNILHICDPARDKTGDLPKKTGIATEDWKCSGCGTPIAEEYILLLKLQKGLGNNHG